MKLIDRLCDHAATAKAPITPAEAAGLRDILMAARDVITSRQGSDAHQLAVLRLTDLLNFAGVDT